MPVNAWRAERNARKHSRSRAPQWAFRRSAGLQILEAAPLKKLNWLVHGFSTRSGGTSALPSLASDGSHTEKVLNLGFTDWDTQRHVEENRHLFANTLRAREMPIVTLRQIHSDIAHPITNSANGSLQGSLQGDALITVTPGLLLAVQTADCIPLLLVDPRHRAVAAVHAGWRGTLARIAAKTLGRMQMEFATRPGEVLAAIGPGIGQCCYEVGPDVVKEYAAKFPEAWNWFEGPFDLLASGEDPNPLPWLTMMPPGHEPPPPRCHLDLKAANVAILVGAGVRKKNILISELCNSCRTDLFFSYRREKTIGRMLSVIGILNR